MDVDLLEDLIGRAGVRPEHPRQKSDTIFHLDLDSIFQASYEEHLSISSDPQTMVKVVAMLGWLQLMSNNA